MGFNTWIDDRDRDSIYDPRSYAERHPVVSKSKAQLQFERIERVINAVADLKRALESYLKFSRGIWQEGIPEYWVTCALENVKKEIKVYLSKKPL